MIKLSLVIPTFNREKLLEETIKSVLNQTLQPSEVIVVDNGTIQPKITEIEKMKYFRLPPFAGVAQARNFGLSIATGEYVMFLDDDDLLELNTIEIVASELMKYRPEVLLLKMKSFESKQIIKEKSKVYNSNSALINDLFIKNPGVVGSSTIIKKSIIFEKKLSGYDPFLTTGQDKSLILDFLLKEPDLKILRSQASFLFRNHSSPSRNTQIKKMIQGKARFIKKYRKRMTFKQKIITRLILTKLVMRSLIKGKPKV